MVYPSEKPLMRALIYNGPWDMTLQELPQPRPGTGEVLLRIKTVGICGSDVHGFTGESGRRAPGMVMGHEAVGEVVDAGNGISRSKIGELAAVFNIIAETAPTAEEGDPSFLAKKVIGVNLAKRGAMAEYLAIPAENALPLPEGVESAVGILAEPLAVVLHGFQRLVDKNIRAKRAAIVGSGTIGLAGILAAKNAGVSAVAILDTIPAKLNRAKSFGAKPIQSSDDVDSVAQRVESALGGQPDLAVDAAGTRASFRQCLSLLQAGGAALLIGNLAKEAPLPLQDVVGREITLVGTYGFDRRAFGEALRMLPKIQDKLASFVEKRCTLEETPAIIARLAKGDLQALKVVIEL